MTQQEKKVSTKGSAKKTGGKTPQNARLGRADGCQVEVRVVERSGNKVDRVEKIVCFPGICLPSKKTAKKTVPHRRPPVGLPGGVARAFAAIGHPQRTKMLLALLAGPTTYAALRKVTKLKAGPLYHHVNQLRMASLIRPRQRDLYELTRGGRNLALLAVAVSGMVEDSRRRPLGSS